MHACRPKLLQGISGRETKIGERMQHLILRGWLRRNLCGVACPPCCKYGHKQACVWVHECGQQSWVLICRSWSTCTHAHSLTQTHAFAPTRIYIQFFKFLELLHTWIKSPMYCPLRCFDLQTARAFIMHIVFSMQNTFTSINFKHLCMQSEHHTPVEHASCVVCTQIQCCLLALKRTGLLEHRSHTCTKTGCSVCLPTYMHTFSHLCMHACTHTHTHAYFWCWASSRA